MPNIKSAKKRVELSAVFTARNRSAKTALKSSIKKCEQAINEGSEQAPIAYKAAIVSIDKAVGDGIIHKNNAARKKSKLTVMLNNSSK